MHAEKYAIRIPGAENFTQEFPGFEGDAQESLGWIIPEGQEELLHEAEQTRATVRLPRLKVVSRQQNPRRSRQQEVVAA